MSIGTHEESSAKKLFFNNFTQDNACDPAHKFTLEVFGDGDIKYQTMISGVNVHKKYWCMCCKAKNFC